MSSDDREARAPEVVVDQPGIEAVPRAVRLDHYQGHRYRFPPANSFQPKRRSLWGLVEGVLGFAVGFICSLLIVDVSIVGGLGARLASCQRSAEQVGSRNLKTSSCEVTTATITSASPQSTIWTPGLLTNFTVPDPSSIDLLRNDCTMAVFTSVLGDKSVTDPGRDHSYGKPALEGGVTADIARLIMYSFGDCVDACSSFTRQGVKHRDLTRCYALTFSLDMKNSTASLYANCWLKNRTLNDLSQAGQNQHCMSARLNSQISFVDCSSH